MKLVALLIVAFTTASYAGNPPSTQTLSPDAFPSDLFHLSLQPALPLPHSQPPAPLFLGHAVRVNLGYMGPSPLKDGTLLPLAPMQPQATLLPPALMRPYGDLIDDRH